MFIWIKYFDHLHYMLQPKPSLTQQEVVDRMRKERGLWGEDESLIRAVKWYLYHNGKNIIKQMINNLEAEVELILPEERGKGFRFVQLNNSSGLSYKILSNGNSDRTYTDYKSGVFSKKVGRILHEELHQYASEPNSNPHQLYLIMKLMRMNEFIKLKKDTRGNDTYYTGTGQYYNTDWYTPETVKEDILAYLRIYVKYKDWPTLRKGVRNAIDGYPSDWLDDINIYEVFQIADEKGIEVAYQLFLRNFNRKVEKGIPVVNVINKPNDCYNIYPKGWEDERDDFSSYTTQP